MLSTNFGVANFGQKAILSALSVAMEAKTQFVNMLKIKAARNIINSYTEKQYSCNCFDTPSALLRGSSLDKQVFIKNIVFSEAQRLVDLVDYEEGRVVSRTFAQNPSLSITLFAFDNGEGVSTHTAPGDALLQVLDGEALVNIDGKEMTVGAGEAVVMPANIPHSVDAVQRFKMLLTVVK